MKVNIYIPYYNGDAINGFEYEGDEITPKKYVKMEETEYLTHKDGVQKMVVTSFGNNMSINPYEKRRINVKEQDSSFHFCEANIVNFTRDDLTVEELENLWLNKQQFGLNVYLNERDYLENFEMETDIKIWISDSNKLLKLDSLTEEEKILHLPKKDFKIDFEDGKYEAVLKNCKFARLLSTLRKDDGKVMATSFSIIVERIIFTKR